ncbi:hypothetical protein DM860_004852 [Cuscuta australis]|uniref:Uncharacterized protein n=1 Tax=Cuscuta australis TaxID=267555 RepID=A0A328DRG9_9ASTE|nr:hypothetical protein DM860_004852 [Cuscuta australis]
MDISKHGNTKGIAYQELSVISFPDKLWSESFIMHAHRLFEECTELYWLLYQPEPEVMTVMPFSKYFSDNIPFFKASDSH